MDIKLNQDAAEGHPDAQAPEKNLERKKVDLPLALHLRAQGKTYQEIADSQGVPVSRLHTTIRKCVEKLPAKVDLDYYRKHCADFLRGTELKTLSLALNKLSLLEEKAEEITYKEAVQVLESLFKMRRLEEGESTANVQVQSFSEMLISLKKQQVTAPFEPLNISIGTAIEEQDLPQPDGAEE